MNKLRIGNGFDSHRLVKDRPLILGGVQIPYSLGLAGHSDADVLIHAIIDSLLGASGLGDLGELFPDHDLQYSNISSLIFLREIQQKLEKEAWQIINIDSVVICEKPKILPYKKQIIASLALNLKIEPSQISLKAKTAEKMGALGREEGIACLSISLLETRS